MVPSTAHSEVALQPTDQFASIALSGIAGFIDAAGFLALFGLFTAHVTGNLVTAGSALARSASGGLVARLAMIPVFMLSVAATSLAIRTLRKHGKDPLLPLLALLTLMLGAFWFAGLTFATSFDGADAAEVILVGGIGVIAMGVQNGLMRQVLTSSAPTTMMTGNLTQFTIDLVEFTMPTAESPSRRLELRNAAGLRLKKVGGPLLGFVLGAALGSGLTRAFSFWSIALPTILGAGLTFRAFGRMPQPERVTRQPVPPV